VSRFWIDTEFNDSMDGSDHNTPESLVRLLSVGIVAEDGREFYGVLHTAKEMCNKWVRENVFPYLHYSGGVEVVDGNPVARPIMVKNFTDRVTLREEISGFLGDAGDKAHEFWGWYADYDHYLISRLWNGFQYMPRRFPMLCYDVRQYAMHLGLETMPAKLLPEHNAMIDARWTRLAWQRCRDVEAERLAKSMGVPVGVEKVEDDHRLRQV
jgi:hypothetical protein